MEHVKWRRGSPLASARGTLAWWTGWAGLLLVWRGGSPLASACGVYGDGPGPAVPGVLYRGRGCGDPPLPDEGEGDFAMK